MITAKRRQKTGGWRRLVPQAALTALGVAEMVRFACTGNRSWLGAAENPDIAQKVVRANLRCRPAFVGAGISLAVAAMLAFSQQGLGRTQAVGVADSSAHDLLGPFRLFPLNSRPIIFVPISPVRLSSAKTGLPISERLE